MDRKPSALRVHLRSDVACIASVERYLLMRCYGEISAQAIYATMEAHAACQAHKGQSVASLVFIDPATQLPSEEARGACVEMIRRTKGTVCSGATVVLGDGFWASALRGVLTTFNVLASHPTRTCRLVEDAVDWTLTWTGDPPETHRPMLIDGVAGMAKHP